MENILIVDDERPIRKLLNTYLKNAGYSCWLAEDALEARALLEKQPIDLLLSDINMPGDSGIDLGKYVKQEYPEVAIVMVSGIDDPDDAKEALAIGVYGYILKPFTRNLVLITVDNALRRHRLEMEQKNYQQALETKVRQQTAEMQTTEEKYQQIVENIGIGVAIIGPNMEIMRMNPHMNHWFPDVKPDAGFLCHQSLLNPPTKLPCDNCPVVKTFAQGKSFDNTIKVEGEKRDRYFRDTSFPLHDENGNVTSAILLVEDVTDKLAFERELRQAQKLESIGQLAAGIAHEINTPIQYVGDNILFIKDSFEDLTTAISAYDDLLQAVKTDSLTDAIVKNVSKCIETADLPYLKEEIPHAIDQSLEGVLRVTEIVRAMRDFSHPGSDQKSIVDLNNAIKNTITVARNEWKYVADMELNLDPLLTEVLCFPGEINQVLLNIIVNAAHSIADVLQQDKEKKGKISISTLKNDKAAVIKISDTGGGIPKDIQHRIFDPFFTTKGVGKGTGQGLAIAHTVITEKHGGNLYFETKPNKGTTFIIELPLENARK